MDDKLLERFYEIVILPRYEEAVRFGEIRWVSHGKIDLDAWAHYFESDGKEYALLYEDYPDGSYLKDGLSHEPVKLGNEYSLKLGFSDNATQIDNLLGWYTLYREKDR